VLVSWFGSYGWSCPCPRLMSPRRRFSDRVRMQVAI
jgi:hypothetical protein